MITSLTASAGSETNSVSLSAAGLEALVDPRKVLRELDEALSQQYLLTNQNITEAFTALKTRDLLIIEEEHPTGWAQIQLLLLRVGRQLGRADGTESKALNENVRRAREILQRKEKLAGEAEAKAIASQVQILIPTRK
jgi:hypothetical protein